MDAYDARDRDRMATSVAYWSFGGIADLVWMERMAQYEKRGPQQHESGTSAWWDEHVNFAREECDEASANDELTWMHVLRGEVFEAFAEEDPVKLKAELVQVMAVAAAWIQNLEGTPA